MATLRDTLSEKVQVWREEASEFVKEHGDKVISEVKISQAYGGMRGVIALVCDTSYVDPEKGLFIAGTPILELADRLPEEVFYLLCTGELPDEEALVALQENLKLRAVVPSYVWDVLQAMPEDSHPMAMLSAAIMAMERESIFKRKYEAGLAKMSFWEATLDDALTLIGRLPNVAAAIYRLRFKKGPRIIPDPKLDWGANYAHMLGEDPRDGEFHRLIRLYMVLHSDHEAGNVSANTCGTVCSALSDLYYAVAAGLNGLAGPLHGLANQQCLEFVFSILDKFDGVPSDEDLKQYVWATLKTGRVIPGYGHAVLRQTDPRFTAFQQFGKEVCPDDPAFKVMDRLYAIVPDILREHGKAKNPWPNVDAASGSLVHHFGITMFDYYTVLFAVSRAMGMCAQAIRARALMAPIIRPKSVTQKWLREKVGASTVAS